MPVSPVVFWIIALVVGLALIGYGIYIWRYHKPAVFYGATVTIRGEVIKVALADNLAKRTRGLSGAPALAADQGMLFLFPFPFKYAFWMKDMNFPLDMVWLKNDTIVGITADVPAPAPGASALSLPQYYPPQAVNKVLEVNAGTAGKYGWAVGDKVQFNLAPDESPQ